MKREQRQKKLRAGRRIEERNIRTLSSTGGGRSYSITLPIEMVRKLKWKERQRLNVRLNEKRLIVEDYKG